MIGVGHVQAKNVDAGGDEFRQLVFAVAGRSHGGHDLGLRIAGRGVGRSGMMMVPFVWSAAICRRFIGTASVRHLSIGKPFAR